VEPHLQKSDQGKHCGHLDHFNNVLTVLELLVYLDQFYVQTRRYNLFNTNNKQSSSYLNTFP